MYVIPQWLSYLVSTERKWSESAVNVSLYLSPICDVLSVQCIVLLHTEYYTERSSILTVMRSCIRGNKQGQELCISRGGLLSVRYERETECIRRYEL